MKEQETYKEQLDREVYDLMYAALELADIIDQSINEHGMITVNYQFASEIIHRAQQSAKTVGDELSWIASGLADIEELYPQYVRKEGGAYEVIKSLKEWWREVKERDNAHLDMEVQNAFGGLLRSAKMGDRYELIQKHYPNILARLEAAAERREKGVEP